MKLKNFNNLLELLFDQYEQQDKSKIFLNYLSKPNLTFTWHQTITLIDLLAKEINKHINKAERCLLLSENRPEWFISDMAIMLAGGITVPTYTTYTSKDYEFIIKDSNPSIIIVSNDNQFNKIKDLINKPEVKKIISFDKLKNNNEKIFFF